MCTVKIAALWFALASVSVAQSPLPGVGSTTGDYGLFYTRTVLAILNTRGMSANQDVNVDFTTAQLNDVLKSLTVLDLGKGRITGVSYNSAAPLEHRLGSLRLPVGENPTTAQFLDALRGARVEVRNGAQAASGRLLSIEEREIIAEQDAAKGDNSEGHGSRGKVTLTQVSLVSDSGEVHLFRPDALD